MCLRYGLSRNRQYIYQTNKQNLYNYTRIESVKKDIDTEDLLSGYSSKDKIRYIK